MTQAPSKGATRRAVLGALAAMPIRLPAAAAMAAEPMFDLIERHRAAHTAHLAAIHKASLLEEIHDAGWSDITEQPCFDENDAFDVLVSAAAATLAGLDAKLAYLREIADGDEAWMLTDRIGIAVQLIRSFDTSLKNIGVRS